MSLQKEFIEKFRRDKYKIGSEKEDIELIKQDLQNSISQLANDLYSDGIHFVLELIQNADDNEYFSSNNPLLKFVIDEEKILVQNNEKGFTNENVISLCSVGKSKKTKEKGYIGEKGIGFKSVFRISDEPHIFSNGFQFKFKRTDEELGLGYIVPYWIEEIPDFIDKELTNILLPLNAEARKELSKFSEIEPELLLFLRRLFAVEIHNKVDNTSHKYTKFFHNEIVKIKSENREDSFKLISQTLKVPENVKEEKRDIEKTDLVLGFPVNANGTAKTECEQKIFAFLPTKGYGFKFMIQADFLVPASREDILKFKKWNAWLRDNISSVFLKSVEIFKKDENLKRSFYKYIPIESEITDKFFLKVVEQLKTKLADSNCILTESGRWLKPSQIFRASKEIRSLISHESLLNFFDKEYISASVEETVDPKILDFLGIATFSINDLIEILKKTEWLKQHSDDWLSNLYNYLRSKLSKSGINTVKKLQIVKLKNGELESPAKEKIFFPLRKKHSYGFEKHLPFINKEIVKGNEEFLKNLGVLNAEPFDVIENYILKDFENNDENKNWKSKTEEVRVGYIKYIKDNLAEYEKIKGNLDRLKNSVWITLKDNKFWLPNKVYLSKEYGNEFNLEFLLSGIENIHFVHPQYIELSKKEIIESELDRSKRKEKLESVLKDWKKFFLKLGAETKPKIESKTAERSHYTSGYNYHRRSIEVFSSQVICSVIDEHNTKKNLQLLKILDANWNYYKNYIRWIDYSFYYDWNVQRKDSDWYIKITNAEWLPAKNGGFDKPSNLFLDKSEIRKLLGDSVSYLDVEIENEDFLKALNINSEVKVETALRILKILVNTKSNDRERFEKLYLFLNENYKGNENQIKKGFNDENLIFIPEISNEYISSEKAIWKDVSQIFGNYRYYLEKYYPKLKNFFVQKLEISEKPIAKDYADILVEISTKDLLEKEDREKVLKIYKELNKFLENEDLEDLSDTNKNWWNEFIEERIFWTSKSAFWRNDDDVFVNDDEELYELFKDREAVAFLKITQSELPKIQHFIKKTGLKSVSQKIKAEIETSVECEYEEELTNNINSLLIYIFRYLYHKESTVYKKLKETGKLLEILSLRCFYVLDLNIRYTLQTESATKDELLYLDKDNFYIKVDNLDDYGRISIELSKAFGSPQGLSEFIETLLLKPSDEKRAESLKIRKISNLPDDEFQWFTKNKTQVVVNEINSASATSDEEDKITNEPNGLPPEDQANRFVESESKKQNSSTSENVNSDETIPSVTVSPSNTKSTSVASPTRSKQNQGTSSRSENSTETNWIAEIDPWKVEVNVSELALTESKTTNFAIEKNSRIGDQNSNNGDEEESYQETLSHQAKREIGRTGEIHALMALQNKFLSKYEKSELIETESGFSILVNSQIKVEIVWLNKYAEEGIGRDIEYTENGETFFIEVKATKTNSKEIFQISRAEWQLSKKEQENFSIFRVYNAGTAQAQCKEIRNPYQKWLEERLLVQSLTIKI